MHKSDITIKRLGKYTPQIAKDLGVLRQAMTSSRSASPIKKERVEEVVGQPDRVLVAAVDNKSGRIVSCLVLSTIYVPESEDDSPGKVAWLGYVTTHPDFRGQGIFKKVMQEGFNWCKERGIGVMEFTSNSNNPERQAARDFYLKYGAEIVAKGVGKGTDLFKWGVDAAITKLN